MSNKANLTGHWLQLGGHGSPWHHNAAPNHWRGCGIAHSGTKVVKAMNVVFVLYQLYSTL
jgi:hypothetical protein